MEVVEFSDKFRPGTTDLDERYIPADMIFDQFVQVYIIQALDQHVVDADVELSDLCDRA